MRKKRLERELNHPHFVGVRLSDIELELLDRKAEILGVSNPNACGNFWWKGNRASGRSGRRYGRTAKSGGGIWKDRCEPESDCTVLQYGRGSFAGYEYEIRHCIAELFALREEVLKMAGDFERDYRGG